ncbi:rhomboid family intramembrane serine protease [Bacteroidota bacterium]
MFNITPTVRNILIINIVISVVQGLLKIDLINFGGLRYILAESFMPYQFFSYMFIHAGFSHIFGNMLALFIFGPWLERTWGPARFITFYLACGIGAGILWSGVNYFETRAVQKDSNYYNVNPDPERFNKFIIDHYQKTPQLDDMIERYAENPDNPQYREESKQVVREIYYMIANIPMVGASGAVFGILMAFGLLFPNTTLMLLFPPIPIKAKYFVMLYGLYELYSTIIQAPGDNIAHFAHLGGMAIAFVLVKHWQKQGYS